MPSDTKLRPVRTYQSAIKILGGTAEAARALKTSQTQICQWRTRHGAFPAAHYLRVQNALAVRGYEASTAVFTFEPVA